METSDQLTMLQSLLDDAHKALPNGPVKGILDSMRLTFESEAKDEGFHRCDDESCENWFYRRAWDDSPFCPKCIREYAEALEDDAITARDVERSK